MRQTRTFKKSMNCRLWLLGWISLFIISLRLKYLNTIERSSSGKAVIRKIGIEENVSCLWKNPAMILLKFTSDGSRKWFHISDVNWNPAGIVHVVKNNGRSCSNTSINKDINVWNCPFHRLHCGQIGIIMFKTRYWHKQLGHYHINFHILKMKANNILIIEGWSLHTFLALFYFFFSWQKFKFMLTNR